MKILLYDIETSPLLSYVWGLWQQDVLKVEADWYMLCFAAKWLGKRKIITSALSDYPLYKKNKENDREVIKALWKLLDEADIVIAHNGDRFDIRKSNARFIAHGLGPPSPYITIDTLKIARKYFKFDSNKLDELGRHLKIGRKVHTGGMKLWFDCMSGDLTAWRKMIRYNKQDVRLLQDVYLKLRPWHENHPSTNGINDEERRCTVCQSTNIHSRGKKQVASGLSYYKRYKCMDCGKWLKGRTHTIKHRDIR